MLRVETRLEDEDERLPHRRERKLKDLGQKYFEKIRGLEKESLEELLQIYRHHLIKLEMEGERFATIDLSERENWRKWGLTRGQLSVAGGFAGAAGGALLDVGTGGLTHGVPTVLGGLVGAAATFWKGAELPEFSLGKGLNVSMGSGKTLEVGPPRSDNFPWILLDSILHCYRRILARAHGRRDEEVLRADGDDSIVRSFPRSRRATLAKWFESCAKGAPKADLEPAVFDAVRSTLEELGSGESPVSR